MRVEQRLGAAEITEFLDEVFPGAMEHFTIEEVGWMRARVRMPFQEWRLRPGGTISGPSLMTLADTALWVAHYRAEESERIVVARRAVPRNQRRFVEDAVEPEESDDRRHKAESETKDDPPG